MQLDVDGLPVRFPYSRIYPEQRKIMHELKLALDNNQHALLEVPACIGRSVALLAVYVAYRQQHADDVNVPIGRCLGWPPARQARASLGRRWARRRPRSSRSATAATGADALAKFTPHVPVHVTPVLEAPLPPVRTHGQQGDEQVQHR